jgi:hypothetical protein
MVDMLGCRLEGLGEGDESGEIGSMREGVTSIVIGVSVHGKFGLVSTSVIPTSSTTGKCGSMCLGGADSSPMDIAISLGRISESSVVGRVSVSVSSGTDTIDTVDTVDIVGCRIPVLENECQRI